MSYVCKKSITYIGTPHLTPNYPNGIYKVWFWGFPKYLNIPNALYNYHN